MTTLISTLNIRDSLYEEPNIKTIFRKNIKIIFADNTASGRPCKIIDNYIQNKILPYYANTRSNAYCGIYMKTLIEDARQYIRKIYKLNDSQKIIFTGSGSTGAINHIVNSLNYNSHTQINILISIYEHFSNILPWIELKNNKQNVNIYTIPINEYYDNDINYIINKFTELNEKDNNIINILSISGCSNVTGIKFPIEQYCNILNEFKKKQITNKNYIFVDYATLAPYEILNGENIDAMFISGHKFIGGTSTPGILIACKELFENKNPYNPGGGCAIKLKDGNVQYFDDIERKEPGGTCNIIGIIRLKYALKILSKFEKIIFNNELYITKYIHRKIDFLKQKYSNFDILFHNINLDNRLSIICLFINNLHYNFIVALFNDLFGIQTRGGISCCGLLEDVIAKIYNYHGWCRITFTWYMTQYEIDYILNAMEFIILYGYNFLKFYNHDKINNLYKCQLK
jgi:selenocysteine lyase/cysteine desulfurase